MRARVFGSAALRTIIFSGNESNCPAGATADGSGSTCAIVGGDEQLSTADGAVTLPTLPMSRPDLSGEVLAMSDRYREIGTDTHNYSAQNPGPFT